MRALQINTVEWITMPQSLCDNCGRQDVFDTTLAQAGKPLDLVIVCKTFIQGVASWI